MKKCISSLCSGIMLTMAGIGWSTSDVQEIGVCYRYDHAGRPVPRITVYGEGGESEVKAARMNGFIFEATGVYKTNILKSNFLIASRFGTKTPIFELSNPEVASWSSSNLIFSQYSESGETIETEVLECFDQHVSAGIRPVYVDAKGEASIWALDPCGLATDLAKRDAVTQCQEKVGVFARAVLFGTEKIDDTTRVNGICTVTAKYACKDI